jgi:hypothetical protein
MPNKENSMPSHIKIHQTLVNKDSVDTVEPIVATDGKFVVIVNYKNYQNKTISPRLYTYSTKHEAVNFFTFLEIKLTT